MSKFLDILEQHDPENEAKKNAGFQAIFFLHEHEVSFSSKDDSEGSKIITLHAEQGDIFLKVIGMEARQVADAEEDQEIDVEAGVERLANKRVLKLDIGGPSALSILKARKLKKERDKADVEGLEIFKKNTEEYKRAIQNAQTRTYNAT